LPENGRSPGRGKGLFGKKGAGLQGVRGGPRSVVAGRGITLRHGPIIKVMSKVL